MKKELRKRALIEQMSYSVSEEEKRAAKISIDVFNATSLLLSKAITYLSEIKAPFSKDPNISPEKVWEFRAAIWKFRDDFIKKIDLFKEASFKCMKATKPFSFDTQVINLLSSFSNSVDEFDKGVRDFQELFDDIKAKDFGAELMKTIEKLETNSKKIKDLIAERVIPHVEKNILSKSWTDDVGARIQTGLGERSRPMIDIEKSRG